MCVAVDISIPDWLSSPDQPTCTYSPPPDNDLSCIGGTLTLCYVLIDINKIFTLVL